MTAVIIDDEPINLSLFEAYGKSLDLDVKTFQNPNVGLEYLLNNEVDILYVDYMMPTLNGIELIQEFRKKHKTIPVIMITAAGGDNELKLKALEVGVTEFLTKPIDSIEFKLRTKTLLDLRVAQKLLQNKAALLEAEVAQATQTIISREKETLKILAKVSVFRDAETHSHISRVAKYSKLVAKELGFDDTEQDIIEIASMLHDIGKIGIDDSVLKKEGALYENEYLQMQNHTTIGYEILKDSQSDYLQHGATVALMHHERYDGSGYPNGLKGEEIHIYGRIVCVVDVFDALVSPRYYKSAWDIPRAIQYLKDERGKSFDPQVVDIFLENIDSVMEIYEEYRTLNR